MIDPFPEGDLVAYLEMARLATKRMPAGVRVNMDLEAKEFNRLEKQLEAHLDSSGPKKELFVEGPHKQE